MYRIHAEQRGGRVIAVPRLARRPRAGRWTSRRCARRPARRRSSGSATPTTRPAGSEPDGAIERAPRGHRGGRRRATAAPAPAVVVDEAYSEFTGHSVIPLRHRFPNVVAVRTASKAYAMAGLRVGFAVGAAGDDPPDRASTGRPGSISTVSVDGGHRARCATPTAMRANVARVQRERPRLAAGLEAAGLRTRSRR